MSVLPYHKRYHGDALTGCMALTLEERGAYQTLLDMIYDRGGPVPDNERLLAGYMNCGLRKWRQMREQLLAKGKIAITENGQITNFRAEKVIENQSKTHRKLIEAGAKGGRTRAENEKKPNENSESEQAKLKAGSSEAQAIRALPDARCQIPDTNTYLPVQCTTPASGNGRQAGQDLAYELAGMVGLILATPSAITTNVNTVEAWLHDGISPDTCREVIRNCVANGGAANTRSLKRFDAVIRHDHAKRNPGAPEQTKPPTIEEQIRMFEEQAARMERIGNSDAAAEFLSKAERMRTVTQRMRAVTEKATWVTQ